MPRGPMSRHTVVSLFSGCGGMDLGFEGGFVFGGRQYDRLPFDVVWANDIREAACATYKLNLRHDIHIGDISDHIVSLPESADVVIGGFPCQDVSINGCRSAGEGGRTVLYRRMIEAVEATEPTVFVAENVKGLLMPHGRAFFARMLQDFELPGYTVHHQLHLASDYGVPQRRERIFIVGVKGDRPFTHPAAITDAVMTTQEALRDLEDAPECADTAHVWSKAKESPDQGRRKLVADKPATTIRAEHHGNIQWHYNRPRRISLREAARLQSFPDAFRFPAGMRESERQIGNAVPPVLAWHIAKAVREHLDHDTGEHRSRSGQKGTLPLSGNRLGEHSKRRKDLLTRGYEQPSHRRTVNVVPVM